MAIRKKKSPRKTAAGRPSREDLGLKPTQQFTVWVEPEVVAKLREEHGSLGNALRAAAAAIKG